MSRQADAPSFDIDADYKPLRDRVRDELRQRIIDDVYPAGTRLVETELAAQLGVSRLPVREAIRALETEGFVRTIPRRGAVVVELSAEDVEELFDVREALEVLASQQAATRATKAELRRVRGILDRGRKALDAGDRIALGKANEAFHDEILKLSHNTLLQAVLEPLQGRLHWLLRQTGDPYDLFEEHAAWFEAIASGAADLAAERARRHARLNREIVRNLLAERQHRAPSA
ncbi:GntR family transcriptional regulator [Sphaerisporangium siamense]|uniref:DNA-binding GntR family transcriptional regulator n=1 Tax=Sphaerisporangium siamense TaxID=795645 RepID=A0A7W7G968_9ACTN|nr:GntR family transcriptional regulator [Sphaerisporangium siamense]MBB4700300.1 DNA-binding GntR family transcriptional regulator [Sphaerisporangium siamense]GII87715.1 GntR family transcriptional regulator [Sphaerisporangium siamense]